MMLSPSVASPHLKSARRALVLGLGTIAVGVLGLLGWAAVATVSGAIVAEATVRVDLDRRTVTHFEGGIVKALRVRDGSRVKMGDILIELEDLRIDASLDQLRATLYAELARQGRLEAQRDVRKEVSYVKELTASPVSADRRELMNKETALFIAKKESFDRQSALLTRQIVEVGGEQASLERQIASAQRTARLMNDELVINEALIAQNYVQKTRILALQRSLAEYETKLAETNTELARARQKKTDLELRRESLRTSYAAEAATDLKDSTAKVIDLRERMRPTADALQRLTVVAPVAGDVVDMKINTLGAAVGPRDALLDIVPAQAKMIVEAKIRADGHQELRVGNSAEVRLLGYKQRSTPLVEGTLSYLSADRSLDKATGQPYYVAHVQISDQALKKAGNLALISGMPAEVYLKTRDRTPLDYLLDPLTAGLRKAMREQ